MDVYQTYIIYSTSLDYCYVEYTAAGEAKRLARHNAGWSEYTRRGISWELKYCRSFTARQEAIRWERFIKRQKSRVFVEKLLRSQENELG